MTEYHITEPGKSRRPMTDSEIIKHMIETVRSPDDTDTLDEIDARVWLFYRGRKELIYQHKPLKKRCWDFKYNTLEGVRFESVDKIEYTRSRDALKAIRPGDVKFNMQDCSELWHEYSGFRCTAIRGVDDYEYYARELPTEELAELHAIIQAIEWKRSNE